MPDFASALNVKIGDVPRPPLPPTGHYTWEITKHTIDESNNGEWEILSFSLVAQEADDDVDTDELSKVGGVQNVRLQHRFMFPKAEDDEAAFQFQQTMKRLETFLWRHVGVPEGTELSEALEATHGSKIIADVVHKQDKNDPETYHANIGRTAPLV